MTTNTQTQTQQQASSGQQAAAGHAEKTNLNTSPCILESDLVGEVGNQKMAGCFIEIEGSSVVHCS